jgi:hypothetical protein
LDACVWEMVSNGKIKTFKQSSDWPVWNELTN